MIVTISQPRYLPWLGYFHRIASSDLFIYLDTVQFTVRDWENRNKVKTPQGWTWLTVPVRAPYQAMIPEVTICTEQPWQSKHWKTIKACYGSAPFFACFSEPMRKVYEENIWRSLTDINLRLTDYICKCFGLNRTRFIMASELNVTGKGSELILDLCLAAGAKVYLSGSEGRNYLNETAFLDSGIRVVYQDYVHPVYPQRYSAFQPYMSAIDLLFNCGEESSKILMKDQNGL